MSTHPPLLDKTLRHTHSWERITELSSTNIQFTTLTLHKGKTGQKPIESQKEVKAEALTLHHCYPALFKNWTHRNRRLHDWVHGGLGVETFSKVEPSMKKQGMPWARSQRTWSLVPVLASTISVMLSKTRKSLWASLPSCERVRSEREEVISKGASHSMNPQSLWL